MRRLMLLALVLITCISLSCGGGVFFISTNGHGVTFFSTSGTISIVQLAFVNGHQVTVVTLLSNGAAQTFNFCGDVTHQFPVDSFVNVNFTENGSCNTLSQISVS